MGQALTFQETWDLAFRYGAEISAKLSQANQNEPEILANVDYGSGMFCHDDKIYWLSDGSRVPDDNYIAQQMRRSGATVGTSIRGNNER